MIHFAGIWVLPANIEQFSFESSAFLEIRAPFVMIDQPLAASAGLYHDTVHVSPPCPAIFGLSCSGAPSRPRSLVIESVGV